MWFVVFVEFRGIDDNVMKICIDENRILVTNDKDFSCSSVALALSNSTNDPGLGVDLHSVSTPQ
jgi:hypothetical protein